jgi:transcriptional regulator with XRE-family HTH domain
MPALSLQNSLGSLVKQERKAQRMTQHMLAKAAGLSVPTIRLVERGRGTLQSFQSVINTLGVELVGRNLPQAEHTDSSDL